MVKVKCLFCNSYFDRETIPCVKIGRRYAHKTCVEGNQELTAEYQEKESFWAYIKKIYGSKYNFQLINTQATQYIEAYHYTWKSMENALRWFYEVKRGNIDEGNGGIGYCPLYAFSRGIRGGSKQERRAGGSLRIGGGLRFFVSSI